MTGLTDTQLVLLSAASQRDDGMIAICDRLKGGVATRVGERLIALGLAEERSTPGFESLWREDDGSGRLGLFITRRGLAAIGVVAADDAFAAEAEGTTGGAQNNQPDEPRDIVSHGTTRAIRPGTKKALVIGLLQRVDGTCLDEIMTATGWQPHTTRAVLTGLRKDGMSIAKVRQAGCVTRFRITSAKLEQSRDLEAAPAFDQGDATVHGDAAVQEHSTDRLHSTNQGVLNAQGDLA